MRNCMNGCSVRVGEKRCYPMASPGTGDCILFWHWGSSLSVIVGVLGTMYSSALSPKASTCICCLAWGSSWIWNSWPLPLALSSCCAIAASLLLLSVGRRGTDAEFRTVAWRKCSFCDVLSFWTAQSNSITRAGVWQGRRYCLLAFWDCTRYCISAWCFQGWWWFTGVPSPRFLLHRAQIQALPQFTNWKKSGTAVPQSSHVRVWLLVTTCDTSGTEIAGHGIGQVCGAWRVLWGPQG